MKKLILLITMVSFTLQAQNLTVSSGTSFTVDKTGSVTITGNFSNSGTFTLNSDADEFSSIIVSGSSTGNIDYNRYVNAVGTDEWDLIGSPLDAVSISTLLLQIQLAQQLLPLMALLMLLENMIMLQILGQTTQPLPLELQGTLI